jgi:hypothetical protein
MTGVRPALASTVPPGCSPWLDDEARHALSTRLRPERCGHACNAALPASLGTHRDPVRQPGPGARRTEEGKLMVGSVAVLSDIHGCCPPWRGGAE